MMGQASTPDFCAQSSFHIILALQDDSFYKNFQKTIRFLVDLHTHVSFMVRSFWLLLEVNVHIPIFWLEALKHLQVIILTLRLIRTMDDILKQATDLYYTKKNFDLELQKPQNSQWRNCLIQLLVEAFFLAASIFMSFFLHTYIQGWIIGLPLVSHLINEVLQSKQLVGFARQLISTVKSTQQFKAVQLHFTWSNIKHFWEKFLKNLWILLLSTLSIIVHYQMPVSILNNVSLFWVEFVINLTFALDFFVFQLSSGQNLWWLDIQSDAENLELQNELANLEAGGEPALPAFH